MTCKLVLKVHKNVQIFFAENILLYQFNPF